MVRGNRRITGDLARVKTFHSLYRLDRLLSAMRKEFGGQDEKKA